jgi:hypothetical protein
MYKVCCVPNGEKSFWSLRAYGVSANEELSGIKAVCPVLVPLKYEKCNT